MRGDIDGDGKITENDRNRINEHLGGTITLTGADSWCAKVTGNNEISASDLVQLMRYLEGKTNNLTGIPTFADAGVDRDNIFVDKQSGKDFNRPAYQDLVSTVQPNDMIIIKSIDRLGRNYSEILEQWSLITKSKKVDIKVLDMPLLDTSYCKDVMGTFISDLVLQVLSFQAEQERTYIKQRQAEGIAAAKSNGVQFGRPRKPLPSNFEELYQRFRKNEPITRLAKECPEISESTLRLRLQERFDLDRKR